MNLLPIEAGNQVNPAPADLNGRAGRGRSIRTVLQYMSDPVKLGAFDTDFFQTIGDRRQDIKGASGGRVDMEDSGFNGSNLFHDFYSFFSSNDMKYGLIQISIRIREYIYLSISYYNNIRNLWTEFSIQRSFKNITLQIIENYTKYTEKYLEAMTYGKVKGISLYIILVSGYRNSLLYKGYTI